MFWCRAQADSDLAAAQSRPGKSPQRLRVDFVGVRAGPGNGTGPVEGRFPGDGFIDTQAPQQGPGLLVQVCGELRGKAEDERGVALTVGPGDSMSGSGKW